MAERIVPSENSLVKYDNPVLVSKHPEKKLQIKAGQLSPRPPGPPARPKSEALTADARRETEEILNSILPPKEWEEENQLWRQQVNISSRVNKDWRNIYCSNKHPCRWTRRQGRQSGIRVVWFRIVEVSSTPATRLDVINLQEQLDMRLQQRQARETGICPVRRELYTQCFDELIRQVTINCAERGLLLLRVRDEIRMTIAAYQTLYESSIAFGMRKALMASIMIAQS
uniref:Uncharacterized protein n=1 Tax=Timema tahoe TaxID=61484 RepID=A0A7R9FHC2_9NEOP|nr:unnamed protein product [Timema tahoe]